MLKTRQRTEQGLSDTGEMEKGANVSVNSNPSWSPFVASVRPVPRSEERKCLARHTKIQVMTDLDDTVKSSGGVRLAGIPLGGIDTRFARGMFYPGVFQFALELATHRLPPLVEPLPIAVLTARAREFKFALGLHDKSQLCLEYVKAGARKGFPNWGVGHVLYGSVAEWICHNRKGLRKFKNFLLLRMKHRAYEDQNACNVAYVYVGDTGEMDLDAAERMLRTTPKNMKAVFLHDVSDGEMRKDTAINGVPVLYFRTYIGAARKAVLHDLMDIHSMLQVVRQAEQDYLLSFGRKESDLRWEELANDARDARDLAILRGIL